MGGHEVWEEEVNWQQRSRETWLKNGDRNSQYFHSRASSRRAKTNILGLFDDTNARKDDRESIIRVVENYFSDILRSNQPSESDYALVLDTVQAPLSPSSSRFLDAMFVAVDIRRAVFDMALSKSPCPDGLPALFYQKFCHMVGSQVTKACLGVLNDDQYLDEVNNTLITLIPKVKNEDRITYFHPISLCNVTYKIVAKALANRLRGVLHEVISKTQSAFIHGRLIFDNAIIGFECMHALRRRKNGHKRALTLKLDMSKAYNRVEWSFLIGMMTRLGFSVSWIGRIMRCVQSVSFSFLINRETCGLLKPSRASGQKVNYQKSALCVSKRVPRRRMVLLADTIGVKLVDCHVKYLGLPSFTGRNKWELFSSIKDIVWNRLKG
ncbi:hypothetical protein Ddye_014729 [Dipteronia dyeriana]|uniref:Reverse transcriptase domain-containing protein n=1 Tax=Dipteronia dyeriana TaxID=168575 RepID=A0AAD9X8X4_9ROSI|nr:hypothetical protein Ddye_014729 [Dipteronia dyeriana]